MRGAGGREEREGVAGPVGWGTRGWWRLVENEGRNGTGQCCFWAPSSQECVRCEVGQGQRSHLPPPHSQRFPPILPPTWEVPWHKGSLSLPTPVDFGAQPPASPSQKALPPGASSALFFRLTPPSLPPSHPLFTPQSDRSSTQPPLYPAPLQASGALG